MIPFNDPYLAGAEEQYLRQVMESGWFCGNGHYAHACESLLQAMYGAQAVLLTSSCSAALEIAAQLLNLAPGDEVILPSFPHVGTATAFARQQAGIVWCDIDPATKGLDPDHLATLITPRTRAVVAVPYCGFACDVTRIQSLCGQHGLPLLEDNAAGIAATFGGRLLGTFGGLSVLSFHQTKNVHCGEGGALLVNRPELVEAAVTTRDRGTNRRAFDEKRVTAYTWQLPGSNYYSSELQAAFLMAQLETLPQATAHRRMLLERYLRNLRPVLPPAGLPGILPTAEPNGHAMYLLCESSAQRGRLIGHLHRAGVQSAFHYQPLHRAPYWNGAYNHIHLPVTDDVAGRILRLPMHFRLSPEQVDFICEVVGAFYRQEQA